MKRIITGIIFSVLLISLSCDEKMFLVKCGECVENEPVEVLLDVKVDDHLGGTEVTPEIRIYEGNLEDSILLGTFKIQFLRLWQYNVPVNKKYTLTATYITGNAVYVAIDSATPRVRYESQKCENPCYYVYDKTVNLRIKYTK